MTSVSDFVKNNLVLCVCTLGLAIVGYLGYRAIIWVTEKWGNAGRVNEAAQEVFRAQQQPQTQQEPEADELNPLAGRVTIGPVVSPAGSLVSEPLREERIITLHTSEDVVNKAKTL